jgi:hypothetical protein
VFPRAGLLFGGRDAHWLPARKTWPQAAKLQTVSLRESFTTGTLSPTEGLLWEVVGLSRRVSVVDGRPRLRLASIPKLEGPYYLAHNGRIFQSLFTDVRELIDNRWEPVARYSKETSPDFSVPVGDSIIVIASRAHDEPGDFPDTEDTVVDLIGPDDDVDRNDPWRRIDAYGTSASVNPDNAVTLTGEQGQAYVVRINHGELQIGRLENAQGILTLPENQAIVLGRDRKLRIGRLEWTAPWADNPPGTL